MALLLLLLGALAGCQPWDQFTARFERLKVRPADDAAAVPLAKGSRRRRAGREESISSFELARSLEKSGQLERAAGAYSEIVRADPHHAAAYHRLAIVHEKLGKPDEAQKFFQQALLEDPTQAGLICDFGYSLYLRGELDAAEVQFQAALARQPEFPRARLHLGLVEARTNRIDNALASFQAAGCNPSEAQANLAYALMVEQRYAEAAQRLNAAVAEHPTSPTLRHRLKEVQAILANSEIPKAGVAPVSHDAAEDARAEIPATRAHISD